MIYKLLLLYFIFSPTVMYAYLDPGSSSFFTQLIVAIIAGSSLTIKLFWERLRLLWQLFTSKIKRK